MTSNSASTTSKPVYYLGLDLTPDALRGVVVDDALDVIAADCVLFENGGAGSLTNPNLNPTSSPSAGMSPNPNASPNPLLSPNPSQTQTQSPTPTLNSSSTAPTPTLAISTILAALDILLSKLASRTNLGYVRSISGSTFAGTVFYQSAAFTSGGSDSFGGVLNGGDNDSDANTATTLESLFFPSSVSASSPSSHSSSPFFALPITPTPTDTSITPFAQLLQDTYYGSASSMAAHCGTSAFAGPFSGLVAAQMIKLRVTMPEVWKGVDAVSGLGAFLVAVLTGGGGRPSPNVADALASGLLDYGSLTASTQKGKNEWEWKWNLDTVRFVAGVENGNDQSETEVRRVMDMIGAGEGKDEDKQGFIAGYFAKKYGFGKETTIHPFTSTHIATYLSLVPTSSDAVLSFGTQDAMIMSTPGSSSSSAFSSPPHPSTLTQSFPHPAQTQSSAQDQGQGSDTSRKWISIITSRNGDVPRTLARDMYTKSWSAFDRLVAIVPPGGSIGLDDKLFSFWFIQPEYESSYITPLPHSSSNSTKLLSQSSQAQHEGPGKPTRGIYRFESGTKANEFRDLRANPRCLIEGQIMGFRTRFGRVVAASGVNALNASAIANANGSVLLNGHHATANATTSTATTPNGHSHGYTPTQPSSSPFPSTTAASPITWSSTPPALPFSPYTSTPLPKRIFATGSASYFPSIVNVVGEVFNSPVFVPQSVLEEGVVWAGLVTALQQSSSGSSAGTGDEGNNREEGLGNVIDGSTSDVGMLNAALARIPSRAGIGGAYLARWGWKRVSGGGAGLNSSSISTTNSPSPPSLAPTTSFEDDIRWLLAKRWAQAQSVTQYQSYSGSSGQHPSTNNNSNLGSGLSGVGLGFGLTLSSSSLSGSSSPSPFSSSLGHSSHGLQTPTSAGPPGLSGLPSPLTSYLSKTPSRRGLHRAKSNLALANEIVVEEDEEEEEGGEVAGDGMSVVVEESEEGVPMESGIYKYPIPTGVNISSSSSSSSLLPYSPATTNTTTTHLLSTSTSLPSLSLTTTNPSITPSHHQPGPLTSLIGPLPTPVPLTSTLHPIAALTTNDADAQFGLVKVAEPDEDAFVCYASMLFEWVRLEGGVWDGIW